jgi:hypothetical protein
MKFLLIGLQAHAMTAQQSYEKYKNALAHNQLEDKKLQDSNTKKAITLIEKGIEYQSSIGYCTYEYDTYIDDSLPNFLHSAEVIEHFKKEGYTIIDVDSFYNDGTKKAKSDLGLAISLEWCK